MSNQYYSLIALRECVKQRIAQRAAEGTTSQKLEDVLDTISRKIARLEEHEDA